MTRGPGKPRSVADDLDLHQPQIGSYSSFTEVKPEDAKPVRRRKIGFDLQGHHRQLVKGRKAVTRESEGK